MVYKHSGDLITADEAVTLLRSLGEVAEADQLDGETQHSMRLPPTIVVRYKMYDPRRDVLMVSFLLRLNKLPFANLSQAFRGHRKYKVIPYDPRSSSDPKSNVQGSPNKEQFLHQYDRDRRSIYMGNLPMNMTEETLTNLVSACGEVIAVVLFKKPVPGSPSRQRRTPRSFQANQVGKMTCFAFVEFSRPDTADDAIVAFVSTHTCLSFSRTRLTALRRTTRT